MAHEEATEDVEKEHAIIADLRVADLRHLSGNVIENDDRGRPAAQSVERPDVFLHRVRQAALAGTIGARDRFCYRRRLQHVHSRRRVRKADLTCFSRLDRVSPYPVKVRIVIPPARLLRSPRSVAYRSLT